MFSWPGKVVACEGKRQGQDSFNKIETFAASLEKFPPLIKRDNPKPNRPAPKALSMQIEIQLMPLKAFN